MTSARRHTRRSSPQAAPRRLGAIGGCLRPSWPSPRSGRRTREAVWSRRAASPSCFNLPRRPVPGLDCTRRAARARQGRETPVAGRALHRGGVAHQDKNPASCAADAGSPPSSTRRGLVEARFTGWRRSPASCDEIIQSAGSLQRAWRAAISSPRAHATHGPCSRYVVDSEGAGMPGSGGSVRGEYFRATSAMCSRLRRCR